MTDMYTTTFYSFKGGVGRTMALVNTAVTYAKRGLRVLVVDFDVEAPGLDTFDVLRPQEEVPGLVNFVAEYVKTGRAPDVTNFIGDCPKIGESGGKLWIMPSGRNGTYAETFGQIDWMDLYECRDGYLLFEDLREQWLTAVRPDYVLIDSRTGYTDTSGICTRQLPDSVVILFFPNEQNLRGLAQVVREIRDEAAEPRGKSIALHFVMSNVPNLDDENLILDGKVDEFKRQLEFRQDPMVVHRYDSLSLLNQAVFSIDRPRSKLAQEYNLIAREISTRNWNDRGGALEFIRRASVPGRWLEDDPNFDRDGLIEKIERAHGDDGEILYRLAELKESDRQPESAAHLIDQAIKHGYDRPEALLKRSRYRADNGHTDDAAEDALRVLTATEFNAPRMIREAAGRLISLKKFEPFEIADSSAVKSLSHSGTVRLATTFNRSRDQLSVAIALCERIIALPNLAPDILRNAKHTLGLSYMGLGRCGKASTMFRDKDLDIGEMGIVDAFNYAMALWGRDKTVDSEAFVRVVKIDQSNGESDNTANYHQCMAIAYWATGETDKSADHLDRARRSLTSLHARWWEFSCWRYLEVNQPTFLRDLGKMKKMIESDPSATPIFMAGPETSASV